MPKLLTDEWLRAQQDLGRDLPVRPGVSGRLQYKVTGGPDGDVVFHVVVEDGRIVESAIGEDEHAGFSMVLTYDDFVASTKGELDQVVGFMRGRVKATGRTGALMSVLPLLHSREYAAVVTALDAQTEY